MSRTPRQFPPLQPEDYLGLLRAVATAMWMAIAGVAGLELLIRTSPAYHWPHWGGFTFNFNLLLGEFTVITAFLTVLLSRRQWLERAPRQAIGKLRRLMLLILALSGLHLLCFFQLAGSVNGPVIVLIPPLLLGVYLVLPAPDANRICGLFVATLAALLIGQHLGLIAERGLLSDAFELETQPRLPGMLVLAAGLAAAILIGRSARDSLDAEGLSLQRRELMFDPGTRLFSRSVLMRRLPGELQRIDREASSASLLMLQIRNLREISVRHGFAEAHEIILRVADALMAVTRMGSDTCSVYGPDGFAVLLPDADEKGAREVAERILATVAREDESAAFPVELSIGIATATDAAATEPTSLLAASREALRRAVNEDAQIAQQGI